MPTTNPPAGGTVRELFDAMSYGPAPEGDAVVRAWLAGHGGAFGHYIGGAFTSPTAGESFSVQNPATGAPLARVAGDPG